MNKHAPGIRSLVVGFTLGVLVSLLLVQATESPEPVIAQNDHYEYHDLVALEGDVRHINQSVGEIRRALDQLSASVSRVDNNLAMYAQPSCVGVPIPDEQTCAATEDASTPIPTMIESAVDQQARLQELSERSIIALQSQAMTLPEWLASEEIAVLPPHIKEQLVADIIRMANQGEISSDQLFP